MTDGSARAGAARTGRAMWAVRIFLALVFIYVGAVKLPAAEGMWVRLFERLAFGQWFRYVTAGVEILGGVLMLMPRATPAAVFLTVSAMAGALLVHATVTGFGPQTVVVCILLALSLFVGSSYSRANRRTIRTRTVGGLSVISVLALFLAMPTPPPAPDDLVWSRDAIWLTIDSMGVLAPMTGAVFRRQLVESRGARRPEVQVGRL